MDNIVFNQSIMGFNRNQVLNYIDTLVKQLKEQEEEYTKNQLSLREELNSLSNKYTENKQDLSLAVDKIKELSFELEESKKNNASLEEKIEYYKDVISRKDNEILELKRNTFGMKTRCDLLSAENDNWKKRQDKIGEAIIEANVRAEEIVKGAEIEAEKTKKDMQKQAANLACDVVTLKSEISSVEKQIEESFIKLRNALDSIDGSAKTIENSVVEYKIRVETLGEKIEENKTDLKNNQSATYHIKEVSKSSKKTLTESVLDTISKILDK